MLNAFKARHETRLTSASSLKLNVPERISNGSPTADQVIF